MAAPGFSCSMWNLVPWPGMEQDPLHWEHRVLTTGPPGNSWEKCFLMRYFHKKPALICYKMVNHGNDVPFLLISVVLLLNQMSDSATPWTIVCQPPPSFTVSQNLLKLMSIELVVPSNPSHPQSSPSLPAFNLSLHQCLFQWVSSSHHVVKVLELQHVLPMNIQDWFPLGWTGLISLLSKGLSRVFSSTTVRKHQFFGAQSSLWSKSHIHTWPLEKPLL